MLVERVLQARYPEGDDPEALIRYGNVADASNERAESKNRQTIKGDDGYPYTAPVEQFRANAFGLFDMMGNAAEVCSDPDGRNGNVVCGTPWDSTSDFSRRWRLVRGISVNTIGFRVVCELPKIGVKEPKVENVPGTIPSDKARSETTSPAKPFLLGYNLGDDSAKWMPEVASYTNIVWDCNWVKNEDARPQCQRTIDVARKLGLQVVLSVSKKRNMDKFLEVGLDFVKANRDVVFAICADEPPPYGIKSDEVTAFGVKVKQALPGIQFWIILVDNKNQQKYVIPSQVDLLVLNYQDCTIPQDLQRRAQDSIPIWLKKFDGRPILLAWDSWKMNSMGLVPNCQPETFRTFAEFVRSNHLAGVLFSRYGPSTLGNHELIGIQTRPELVSEVKSIAKQWGIANP